MAQSSRMGDLFLNKEVSLKELNNGIDFEIDCDQQCTDSEDESYFENEVFDTFKEDIASMDGDHKPKLLGGANIPFTALKDRMEPVTADRKIMKEVIQCGSGMPIPDKSVVMMHYDAYLENQTQPFDSTRLRKRPYKFLFGDGNVLPGLELSIKTMKKGEMGRFLVNPDYAYGVMGCPPRIPASAEILYEVEILNFYDSKDAVEYENMTPEDQKKAPFEKITDVYHCENTFANELFQKKMFKPAIARYRKMANMLDTVSVSNEEQDEKRNSYLLKIYKNLSQCYINTQNPQKAIIYADLALKIDEDDVKALYRMGYALHSTGEYERAEYYLHKAKKFKPYEKHINAAIAKLEFKRKQHLDWEKMFCKKSMSFQNGDCETESNLLETSEFISAIEEQIETFMESDEREMTFSSGYTENQLEVVKELARKFDLAFVSKIVCDLKINKIVKKGLKNP